MKQALTYIAKRGISKWIARDTARAYWANLISNGWTKDGTSLTKDNHCFTFEPHGARVALSYKKLEVALEDDAYANYGSKLPHPQL